MTTLYLSHTGRLHRLIGCAGPNPNSMDLSRWEIHIAAKHNRLCKKCCSGLLF